MPAGRPVVLAGGVGLLAERALAVAGAGGVPVRQDPSLAQALALLELGERIPEPLFVAVAEALAWAYRLDSRAAG